MDPETITPKSASEQNAETLAAELARYHDVLLPGAAATLAELPGWYPRDARLSRAQLAEKVAERLFGKGSHYARHLNPEAPKPAEGQSAVRLALARIPEIREDKREELAASLGAELNHLPAHQVLVKILAKLESPSWRETCGTLAVRPGLSSSAARVRDVIVAHFHEVPLAMRDDLAKSFASNGVDASDETVVRQLATMLSRKPIAAKYGVAPIGDDDYRHRYSRALHGSRSGATSPESDPTKPRRPSLVR